MLHIVASAAARRSVKNKAPTTNQKVTFNIWEKVGLTGLVLFCFTILGANVYRLF